MTLYGAAVLLVVFGALLVALDALLLAATPWLLARLSRASAVARTSSPTNGGAARAAPNVPASVHTGSGKVGAAHATGVLGLVLAWAILHNRKRTRAERLLTEQATKENYRRGDG